MKPLARSSGDTLADRRADYAEMLYGSGEATAAAEIMLGAMELAPQWALGWFRLGEFHEAAGMLDAARQAWTMALTLDPADRTGAALKLALAGSDAEPPSPAAFFETLFDQYADSFDQSLVEVLDYRAPELIMHALLEAGNGRFGDAVDLGCGTGLMGERLRPYCERLDGYDISARMLEKARGKGVYDRLVRADLNALELPAESVDLVVAADVFIYVGGLETILARVARALRPGGIVAFSVESADGDRAVLLPSRRFGHSDAYLRRVLTDSGLTIEVLRNCVLRKDAGAAVEGRIVVARR